MEPSTKSLRLPRSPLWPDLRERWLLDHPTCAACGSNTAVQVHHKIPVHVNRSLELTPANLITLCENGPEDTGKDTHCHLKYGHLGNWFNYNRNVELDTRKAMLEKYDSTNTVHSPHNAAPPVEILPPEPAELMAIAPEKHPAAAAPTDKPADTPVFRRPHRHR